jgi:hypothetical protein
MQMNARFRIPVCRGMHVVYCIPVCRWMQNTYMQGNAWNLLHTWMQMNARFRIPVCMGMHEVFCIPGCRWMRASEYLFAGECMKSTAYLDAGECRIPICRGMHEVYCIHLHWIGAFWIPVKWTSEPFCILHVPELVFLMSGLVCQYLKSGLVKVCTLTPALKL